MNGQYQRIGRAIHVRPIELFGQLLAEWCADGYFAMVTKTEGIEEVQYIHIKKENQKMKNITKSIILSAAVAALAALLLAGCRREKAAQAKNAPAENSRTAVDSTRMEMELIEWVGAGVELDR